MADHNKMSSPVPDDLRNAARDLNSGAIHLLRGMRNVDRESGLTPARLSALSVLVFGGPGTLGRLARAEEVAGPTMTRIVDGLCALGLAERREHPDNGRAVIVSATPAGHQLMETAAQRRFDAIIDAMAELPEADREALVMAALPLRRLAAIVRERSDAAKDAPP
ncbi:MAG TPA: MarR family winged helix-turn-helix transcriptional regulator [Thermomicrobiales bacterium]|nr:MarR family winged helix-turn-helix transcriptional regulator [Thermomicrobiales bacterium]